MPGLVTKAEQLGKKMCDARKEIESRRAKLTALEDVGEEIPLMNLEDI